MAFTDTADTLRSRLHITPLSPAVLGVLLAAAAALAAGGLVLATALAPPALEIRPDANAADAPEAPVEGAAPECALAYVHVGGAVAAPGVYALPEGSRVEDAIAAAGGLAEGAASDGVNRARVIVDGEQVVIPTIEQATGLPPASGTASSGSGEAPAAAGRRVNLNAATAAELVTLNGIGEATAAKIIADREANGPFATVDDLMRVPGIGEKKLAALRDSLCV